MSRSSLYTVGADPELFLKQRNGKIISAIGKIGGTKAEPRKVEHLGKGFAVQEDNVLVEYNIPACNNLDTFHHCNLVMMDYLTNYVRDKHNLFLDVSASQELEADQLTDLKALEFGCEPDFNVWTMDENPRPQCDNPNLRSAGGHIHIGLKMGRMDKITLGRLLDATLGLWSVTVDKDKRRRQLYGKAGAIRFKPYGLEYRTMSNFWLGDRTHLITVWQKVAEAIQMWREGNMSLLDKFGGEIMKAIDNSDVVAATSMIKAQR